MFVYGGAVRPGKNDGKWGEVTAGATAGCGRDGGLAGTAARDHRAARATI